MTIAGVIILILLGISGLAIGIYELIIFQDEEGILAMIFGIIHALINAILIVCLINGNTETTKKVTDKETITAEIIFDEERIYKEWMVKDIK